MIQRVEIYVLPGGRLPQRQTEGAAGFDVYLRAIVSPYEMDEKDPVLRKTLFDFSNFPEDEGARSLVEEVPSVSRTGRKNELVYRLDAGESVVGGIGFVLAMPFPVFYLVLPRSGLLFKQGIAAADGAHPGYAGAPSAVDSDYRGEACVQICNYSNNPFYLCRGMRVAQIIFQRALVPEFEMVDCYGKLQGSARGAGGFGSTGIDGSR